MAYNVPWNPRHISANSLTLSFKTRLLPCSLQKRGLEGWTLLITARFNVAVRTQALSQKGRKLPAGTRCLVNLTLAQHS